MFYLQLYAFDYISGNGGGQSTDQHFLCVLVVLVPCCSVVANCEESWSRRWRLDTHGLGLWWLGCACVALVPLPWPADHAGVISVLSGKRFAYAQSRASIYVSRCFYGNWALRSAWRFRVCMCTLMLYRYACVCMSVCM